jgi:hypothetical protein
MRGGSGSAQLKVSQDTCSNLKKLKAESNAKSVDAVIQELMSRPKGQIDQDGRSSSEEEGSGEPGKKRKIDVREPLYSVEILKERARMLEYYTGFDLPAVELLIRRFREVSLTFSFFPFLLFCQEASSGYGPCAVVSFPAYRSLNSTLLIGERATTAFES